MRTMTRRPTHPGEIIKEHYLIPLKITVSTAAEALGVSRKTLSKIVNQKGPVTTDMALRLSRHFAQLLSYGLIYNGTMISGILLMRLRHGRMPERC